MKKYQAKIIKKDYSEKYVDTSYYSNVTTFSGTATNFSGRPTFISGISYGPKVFSGYMEKILKAKFQVPELNNKVFSFETKNKDGFNGIKDDIEVVFENDKPYLVKIHNNTPFIANCEKSWKQLKPSLMMLFFCLFVFLGLEVFLGYKNIFHNNSLYNFFNVHFLGASHLSERMLKFSKVVLPILLFVTCFSYYSKFILAKRKFGQMLELLEGKPYLFDIYTTPSKRIYKWMIVLLLVLIPAQYSYVFYQNDETSQYYKNYNEDRTFYDSFSKSTSSPLNGIKEVDFNNLKQATNNGNVINYRTYYLNANSPNLFVIKSYIKFSLYPENCKTFEPFFYMKNGYNYYYIGSDAEQPNCKVSLQANSIALKDMKNLLKIPEEQWVNVFSLEDGLNDYKKN